MRCLYPPPPHTGIAPTNQPRPNNMLSLADLPSTLSDLCAAASKAAEVYKEPVQVFKMSEFKYGGGELPDQDLRKMVCYLDALKTAMRAHTGSTTLRLLSFKLPEHARDCVSTAALNVWRVYDAACAKVHAAYPDTFAHAAAMQAIIVEYYAFAPATLAAWPAYIYFPMPRMFAVPSKERAHALHASETYLRALMYEILRTDAHALAKCRSASTRKNTARARTLLDSARVQQYVLLNIAATEGSTVPHEHDDASTIGDVSLKRTLTKVHDLHRQAVTDIAFDDSEDEDSEDDDERFAKLVADLPRTRRPPSPPQSYPLLANTRPRKRACKA